MAIFDKTGLLQKLVQKIRSNGIGGLTRAVDVRQFLTDLIDTMFSLAGQSTSADADLEWKADATYNTTDNKFAIYNQRIFESKTDANTGNLPPSVQDVNGNFENTYWIEVSPAPASGIVAWAAGVYGKGLKIVYHNKLLYELLVPDAERPFKSTDIAAEITALKWGVAGMNPANYYTKAETDGAIETKAELADFTADNPTWWGAAIITINAALLKLKEKILAIRQVPAGVTGQVVGFDINGNPIAQEAPSGSGKVRHDTYTALALSGTIAWDVINVAEGKAKITIPSAWAGTNIAFSLSNAADGFTGILSIYNNDTVAHNINLPAAGSYAVSEGETAAVTLPAGALTELNFAYDGTKIKVTKGAFVAI